MDIKEHVENFMVVVGREHFPSRPIVLGPMIETIHGTAVNINDDPASVKARLEGTPVVQERNIHFVSGVVRERTREVVSMDNEGTEIVEEVGIYDVGNLQEILEKLEGKRVGITIRVM